MSNNLERAKELLPAVILTILSMIQALALELFWTRFTESDYLWGIGWHAAIGWLQLITMFIGILLIWVFYVSFVLRFTWLPSLEDTVIPFFIGLMEFAMIDLLHPDSLSQWCLLLALVFGVATAASHLTMRRAREDPANDYFFSQVPPASWGDYRISILVVVALASMAGLLWIFDHNRALSILALVIGLAGMIYQLDRARYYWMHSLVQEGSGRGDEGE